MSKDGNELGGFSRIAGGLSDLINLLVDLDKGGDLPRQGRREKDGLVVEYRSAKGHWAVRAPTHPRRQRSRHEQSPRSAPRRVPRNAPAPR